MQYKLINGETLDYGRSNAPPTYANGSIVRVEHGLKVDHRTWVVGPFNQLEIPGISWLGQVDRAARYEILSFINNGMSSNFIFHEPATIIKAIDFSASLYMPYRSRYHNWCHWLPQGRNVFVGVGFPRKKTSPARRIFIHSYLEDLPPGIGVSRDSWPFYEWDKAATSVIGQQDQRIYIESSSDLRGLADDADDTNQYMRLLSYIYFGSYAPSHSRMTIKKLRWFRRKQGDADHILSELLDLGIVIVEGPDRYIRYRTETDLITAIEVLSWFK